MISEQYDQISAASPVAQRNAARVAAGRRLAQLLQVYRGSRALVLALPPGGVPVAGEIARALRLQVDALVASELFLPQYSSVAVGALSEGGGLVFNRTVLRMPGITMAAVWQVAQLQREHIAQLAQIYRHGRSLPMLYRRPVILVDDGLGSGLAQLAMLQALRHVHAQSCIVASPGGAAAAIERVRQSCDEFVTLADSAPIALAGHGSLAPSDDEAAALLANYRMRRAAIA